MDRTRSLIRTSVKLNGQILSGSTRHKIFIMINDPYLGIIQKVKSLNLTDELVEKSVNMYLKEGEKATSEYLITDEKLPADNASILLTEIKKEFRDSYYSNALYSGIFMFLFLFTAATIFVVSHEINFWFYFFTVIGTFLAYFFIRSLLKALRIKT